MPRLSVRVVNAKLVAKNLQKLRLEVPAISREHIEKLGRRVVKEMRHYPPQHKGSTYVRTYRFKNSWKVKTLQKGISITNDAAFRGKKYSNYVVGDAKGDGQAQVHSGNWLLFRDVVDYEMTKLPNAVYDAIKLYAGRLGLHAR